MTRPRRASLQDRDTPETLDNRLAGLRRAGEWRALAELVDASFPDRSGLSPDVSLLRAEAALALGDAHQAVQITNGILSGASPPATPLRARSLLIRSVAARLRGFPQKALEDASAATALVESDIAQIDLTIQGHKQLGIIFGMSGDLIDSIGHLERALKLCAKSGDLGLMADVHTNLGVALARLGQLPEAQVHFRVGHAAYEKLGNKTQVSDALNNIGRVHFLLGEYELALDFFRRGLAAAQEAGYERTMAMTQVNIGDSLRLAGKHEDAIHAYEGALSAGGKALEPRLFCCANTGLGLAHHAQRNIEKAHFFLTQAKYEAGRLGLKYEEALATMGVAGLEIETANYTAARAGLKSASETFTGLGTPVPLVAAYLNMAAVDLRTKRWNALHDTLQALACLTQELDLGPVLRRETRQRPEIVEYAASKRIAGGFFVRLRRELKGLEPAPRSRAGVTKDMPEDPEVLPRVEARTFGEVTVSADGRPLRADEWESRKAQELFLYLLCEPGGKRREELLEILWPEIAVNLSRNALYNNVYRTRRALYRDCIVLTDRLYRLNPRGAFSCDLFEFERLMKEADREPAGSPGRIARLEQAAALYDGPFLNNWYAEWVEQVRFRTESLFLRCLSELAGQRFSRGEFAQAALLLQRSLNVDSTNPEVQDRLVRTLVNMGNVAEARRRRSHFAHAVRKVTEPGPTDGEPARSRVSVAAGPP